MSWHAPVQVDRMPGDRKASSARLERTMSTFVDPDDLKLLRLIGALSVVFRGGG